MESFFRLLMFSTCFILCLTDKDVLNLKLYSTNHRVNEKESTLSHLFRDSRNKTKQLYPNCGSDPECVKYAEKPKDCSDILQSGQSKSGVYTIWPKSGTSASKSLDVYCDMDTDGGGWTVIQRRGQFSTPMDYFYKDWQSYKNGFGNLAEEFWIGNDNIHALTTQASYKMRVDLRNADNEDGFAEYNTFRIEDEDANYKLHVGGWKGNCGDGLTYEDGMQFSTKDRNNDRSGSPCAVGEQGAWWYNSCTDANLNGLNRPGVVSAESCYWYNWIMKAVGLSGVEMKLRS